MWGKGLSNVRLKDLKKLLGFVHREEIEIPIGALELARSGMQHLVGEIDHLRGLDASALRAVLVAVIAERLAAEKPRIYVVPNAET